jgi:filamentous hemagglutinin family protein
MNINFGRVLGSLSLLLFSTSTTVLANPLGGTVAHGAATITPGASVLTINQTSSRAVINWNSFNIANGESALFNFNGPAGANSAVLNRVGAGNPSFISGLLQSRVGPNGPIGGTVLLLNPSGIIFSPTARVSVGSLIGSTLNLDDRQFLDNTTLTLSGSSTAGIHNQGSLQARGNIFLIANTVKNSGKISAGDHAGLAAGNSVTLGHIGNERLTVNAGVASGAANGVENTVEGSIKAVTAELKAAGGNIYALAINNGGAVRATTLTREGGRVYLRASGGNIQNSGTISANNSRGKGGSVVLDGGHNADSPATVTSSGTIATRGRGKGGSVQMTGDHVGLFDESLVDVSGGAGGGAALIGGDFHGGNPNVQNAEKTYVGPDATIKADALSTGDGGKVIVWSDKATRFFGEISAQGASSAGNGGFAEVSAAQFLDFEGGVNLRAPAGLPGTLLLDPDTISIPIPSKLKSSAAARFLRQALSFSMMPPPRQPLILPRSTLSALAPLSFFKRKMTSPSRTQFQ